MKKYLNQYEKDTWIILLLATVHLDENVTVFSRHLNSEEVRKLKTASTFIKNAYSSMSSRLDHKSKKQMTNYIKQNDIKVLSKEHSKVQEDKLEGKMIVNTDTVEKLTSSMCSQFCKNCTTEHTECDLYGIFDDLRMDGFNLFENCPYSFRDKEDDTIEKKKKKSRRYMKKHDNRYDDDEDVYEYNFKIKNIKGR